MRAVWAVDHALRSTSKAMTRRLGVTGPQRLVLRLVGRTPGISAGELSTALHVHPSTLTGVLGRLVSRGLLVRNKDRADARRTSFHLTARGSVLDRSRAGTVEAAVVRMLSSQPARRLTIAREVLSALVDQLEAD